LPDCTGGGLPTLTPGILTVGTAAPPTSPWYAGDSPSSGEGLESAVAYALAGALDYGPDQVTWAVVDRAAAAAGTVGGFDFDLNQFTAPDAGTPTADYSTGYFSVTDTLVVRRSEWAPPTTAAAIKGLTLGAVTGSPGESAVRLVAGISPTAFAGDQQALDGLRAGTVGGVVMPTPAALAAVAEDPTLAVVGQLPTDPSIQPNQFKVLLPKDSALTGYVSSAVDRLRVEGTLTDLAEQWLDPLVPELN
jgi:polar amino acid transport system substrate-binding protein